MMERRPGFRKAETVGTWGLGWMGVRTLGSGWSGPGWVLQKMQGKEEKGRFKIVLMH